MLLSVFQRVEPKNHRVKQTGVCDRLDPKSCAEPGGSQHGDVLDDNDGNETADHERDPER